MLLENCFVEQNLHHVLLAVEHIRYIYQTQAISEMHIDPSLHKICITFLPLYIPYFKNIPYL